MQEHSIITHKKTQFLHGYYLAYVINKGVTATLDLNPTYYVLKDCHTKAPHHQAQQITSQYNLLSSHILMINSPTINNKVQNYQPLIDKLKQQGWKVYPLIIITAGARGTTHAPSMNQLIATFQLAENAVKNTFEAINTTTIQHAGSILLHKRRIENNQSIPNDQ
jgi:hypothetical protein